MDSGTWQKWEGRVIAFLVAFSIALQVFLANYHPAPVTTIGAENVNNPIIASGVQCKAGSLNCVDARNGSSIVTYSDNGSTQTIKLNGSTGSIEASGVITTDGGYIGITPVPTATVDPRRLIYGATETPANQKIVCGQTNVTGTGTLATGLATPSYGVVSLAGDVTGDHARVSYTNSGGTVTAKVWNSALTPAAASGAVVVDWCFVGTP